LYAAADAERISEYILCIEEKQKPETLQTVGARQVKRDIALEERIYLAVPYDERNEAKALGARWDAVKKAWYVGPEMDPAKLAKWELRHQLEPTLDPRAEFAAVLRSIGGIVDGDHPIMNGEAHRIATHDDKRGGRTIFYVAHVDGVPNGYAENNRTKEVVRWKARGQLLSQEEKAELLAQAEQKRYVRRQAQQQIYEATSKRLSEELRGLGYSARDNGIPQGEADRREARRPSARRRRLSARLRFARQAVDSSVHQGGRNKAIRKGLTFRRWL
jgi:hypothetical protein